MSHDYTHEWINHAGERFLLRMVIHMLPCGICFL